MTAGRAEELVDTAMTQRNTPLLLAAARAGHPLPTRAEPLLSGLAGDGFRTHVAEAHQQLQIGATDEVRPDPAGEYPPPVLATPKLREAMVALLAATRSDPPARPYPGQSATVDDVLAFARPATAAKANHLKGELRKLVELGYATLDRSVTPETLRPGPMLATWTGTWVRDELPAMLQRLDP